MEHGLVDTAGKSPLYMPQLVPPGLLVITGINAAVAPSVHFCGSLNGIDLFAGKVHAACLQTVEIKDIPAV